MQQIVLPIKDSNVFKELQDTLLHNFKAGRRNYTIFQLGKATLLRVIDVMRLRWIDVFNENGTVRQNAFIHDPKTGQTDLLAYRAWIQEKDLFSDWLFPSIQHPDRHIMEKQFYKVMSKVSDLLGINYLVLIRCAKRAPIVSIRNRIIILA